MANGIKGRSSKFCEGSRVRHIVSLFQELQIIQFRQTVKELHVLIFNTKNSLQNYSFVRSQLNGYKNCYVSLIQFDSHLFTDSEMVKEFYF